MNAIQPLAPHARRAPSTHFVQVRSGACVDLLVPDLGPVSLTDIATALSRIPRFLGHTVGATPYSVAQHSTLVGDCLRAWGCPPQVQLSGLFHDVPEALIGDCPSPVKMLLGAAWAAIEARMADAVCRRFRLGVALDALPIRQADAALLWTEKRCLLKPGAWPWPGERDAQLLGITIVPEAASLAHAHWLAAVTRTGEACGLRLHDMMGAAG